MPPRVCPVITKTSDGLPPCSAVSVVSFIYSFSLIVYKFITAYSSYTLIISPLSTANSLVTVLTLVTLNITLPFNVIFTAALLQSAQAAPYLISHNPFISEMNLNSPLFGSLVGLEAAPQIVIPSEGGPYWVSLFKLLLLAAAPLSRNCGLILSKFVVIYACESSTLRFRTFTKSINVFSTVPSCIFLGMLFPFSYLFILTLYSISGPSYVITK